MPSYNGWTNYETWNAKLWMDNDQGEQEYWDEAADACLTEHDGDALEAEDQLATLLEDYHEEYMPQCHGMYADILSAAIGDINWHEIAASLLVDAADRWALAQTGVDE